MDSKVFYFTLLVALCGLAAGHKYKSGECPQVEPMQGFDMKKVSHDEEAQWKSGYRLNLIQLP